MKNMYEIFDEIDMALTKKEKMKVIENNLSQTLVNVLLLTFHPDYKWKYKEFPEQYRIPDTKPGISVCQLGTELRKMYLFRVGDPTAENLSDRKRKELLIQFLESLEPREAEVVIGIFKKDQGVDGLTYDFVKEAFPQLLP